MLKPAQALGQQEQALEPAKSLLAKAWAVQWVVQRAEQARLVWARARSPVRALWLATRL